MFKKRIEILADAKSWPLERVPADIEKVVGSWEPDLLVALIHTALWTRPPVSHGIHLSDFWAWLRYHRAISQKELELRLCEEWQDVDPHQKTILSDELGVGFTTYLLCEKLGCLGFVDTLYLQKQKSLKKYFLTGSKHKRGRNKSPDYISIDSRNKLYILECKGTQTSRAALSRAIARGQDQKKSISISRPGLIKHSLVAGLFVPQWKNKKAHPCIMLADPTWQEIEIALSESSQADRSTSILQILLAKHFSLIGLSDIARALVETDAREFEFTEGMQTSTRRWLQIPEVENMRVLVDTGRDVSAVNQGDTELPRNIRFSVRLPKELEIVLIAMIDNRNEASRRFRTFFLGLQEELISTDSTGSRRDIVDDPSRWRSYSSDSSSTVDSPLGFTFSLEMSRSVRTVSQ